MVSEVIMLESARLASPSRTCSSPHRAPQKRLSVITGTMPFTAPSVAVNSLFNRWPKELVLTSPLPCHLGNQTVKQAIYSTEIRADYFFCIYNPTCISRTEIKPQFFRHSPPNARRFTQND